MVDVLVWKKGGEEEVDVEEWWRRRWEKVDGKVEMVDVEKC